MAYITLSDAKLYLGIATTSTADDALFTQLISRATDMINRWCGQTFEAAQDSSRSFDAVADVDGAMLYLDRPLCAITSITNGDGTTITAAQYVTEPRNDTPYWAIRLLTTANVTWESQVDGDEENAITVVGKWAYSIMAPPTISQACARLVAFMYRQRDNTSDLDRAIVTGNATILPAQIPSDIAQMLQQYRRLGVG